MNAVITQTSPLRIRTPGSDSDAPATDQSGMSLAQGQQVTYELQGWTLVITGAAS